MPSPVSPGAIARLLTGRIPGQVVLQFTNRCNAACAQCGMRRSAEIERTHLDTDEMKRLIDAMAARGVAALSFTGGEPLLHLEQVAECVRHAVNAGIPYVRTGTNGFVFRNPDDDGFEKRVRAMAETLAQSGLYTFWISLDSADPATHEANRGLPGVVRGIAKALPWFHEAGLYPAANLGINRLTGGPTAPLPGPEAFEPAAFYQAARRAFARFYQATEELGFTMANACYPMSLEPAEADREAVYAATSTADMIRFRPEEKALLFRALLDTIPEFRSRLRIFSPRSALLALVRQYSHAAPENGNGNGFGPLEYPCRGGKDFFFIDCADGSTYPCGYRGDEDLGHFARLDRDMLDHRETCRRCDWECFRDPSQMLGPLTQVLRRPHRLALGMLRDRTMARTWLEDVRYYRACHWFDGRRPPDRAALDAFAGMNPPESVAPGLASSASRAST
jgi:MoaA/NifB/PqqE/SkfB family radical SAM enzyme